jgi:hypothetical protein
MRVRGMLAGVEHSGNRCKPLIRVHFGNERTLRNESRATQTAKLLQQCLRYYLSNCGVPCTTKEA